MVHVFTKLCLHLFSSLCLLFSRSNTHHILPEAVEEGAHVEVVEALHHGSFTRIVRKQCVVLAIFRRQVGTGDLAAGKKEKEVRLGRENRLH